MATGAAIAAALILLPGCASQFAGADSAGKALGIVTEHCAAYGPLKTTRATKTEGPKVRFGAAIVCEK